MPQIFMRMQFLLEHGFQLFDIVDLAYYRGTLSQVDLIFVKRELYDTIDALVPWKKTTFDNAKWYPLTTKAFQNQ